MVGEAAVNSGGPIEPASVNKSVRPLLTLGYRSWRDLRNRSWKDMESMGFSQIRPPSGRTGRRSLQIQPKREFRHGALSDLDR